MAHVYGGMLIALALWLVLKPAAVKPGLVADR